MATWLGHRCPDIWLNIILGMAMKRFLNEINIWFSRLNKADSRSQSGGHYLICWRPEWNKRLNKKEFSLSAWLSLRWDIDLPCLCIHTQKLIPMVLLVLALRRKVYHRLFWVWVSQPPRLQEPIPYHKSLLNIYIYTHSCAHICIFPPPIVSVSLRQTKNNLGS